MASLTHEIKKAVMQKNKKYKKTADNKKKKIVNLFIKIEIKKLKKNLTYRLFVTGTRFSLYNASHVT